MIIGVVGKPSVGKSTFFKACTLADVDIANYPFTTIKPNNAVGFVKVDPCADVEFGKQVELVDLLIIIILLLQPRLNGIVIMNLPYKLKQVVPMVPLLHGSILMVIRILMMKANESFI